jgi:hypothetical protein
MDPERLQQIERLYHAAPEREEGQRAGFLREARGADEALHRQVSSEAAKCGLWGIDSSKAAARSLSVVRGISGAIARAGATNAESFIEMPAMELAAGALARDETERGHMIGSL